MNEEESARNAARAAYEASCSVHGREADDREFSVQVAEWLAVARAVRGSPDGLPDDASQYVRNVVEQGGMAGLEREARRLLHKMRVAASLYRDGAVKAILTPIDDVERRVDHAVATGGMSWLAMEIEGMQRRIVAAQGIADPGGRAALVLHTDEDKWERYDSYAKYRESFGIAD
jgi:hypothetical protein